jgi:hypothetical protein
VPRDPHHGCFPGNVDEQQWRGGEFDDECGIEWEHEFDQRERDEWVDE